MQPAQLAKAVQRYEQLVALGSSITTHTSRGGIASVGGNRNPMQPNRPAFQPPTVTVTPDEKECQAWVVQAGAALADVFPERHAARVTWERLIQSNAGKYINPCLDQLRGIFNGAAELVRQGYVGTLIESIQAETLVELLDQADDHLAQGSLIAAVGIAGGVLETHLRHLIDRHNLAVQGHGSIEKYNLLIRKEAKEIYSLGDQKQITAWGHTRNLADHEPLKFNNSKEEVLLMLQGIRNFLNKVP
jgi:hypothetical protein